MHCNLVVRDRSWIHSIGRLCCPNHQIGNILFGHNSCSYSKAIRYINSKYFLAILLSLPLKRKMNVLGRVTSLVQFIFWFATTLCQGLSSGSIIMNGQAALTSQPNIFDKILACLTFALCASSLIVHCFADKTPLYSNIQGKF